jgi:hypothetical protein
VEVDPLLDVEVDPLLDVEYVEVDPLLEMKMFATFNIMGFDDIH